MQAASTTHTSPSQRLVRLAAVGVSTTFIALQFFRWPITGLITPFLEPFLEQGFALALLVVTVIAIVFAFLHWKRLRTRALIPPAICLLAITATLWVPFNQIYFATNFHLLHQRRTSVAISILRGPEGSAPNSGGRGNLISLSPKDYLLSSEGEVMVDHRDGKVFVLFFTYRGILDRFSGFVYSPSDDPPAKDQFLGDGIEIERLAPHWFWYAS